MRVLVVVEDNDEMRILVQRALRSDDRLEVGGWASTAAEAVEEARQTQPDLAILDHFIFGDVHGLQAAPMLKAVSPNTKILMFSDHDLTTEAEREPAVDAFLPKQRIRDLLKTVKDLLGLA